MNEVFDKPAELLAAHAQKVPDWNLVHFDVNCARCGHNVRRQTEPKCPACGLEFTWAEAVPLEKLTCGKCEYHLYGLSEPRCPECGESFDWNDALPRFRRKQKPLFEYRWRDSPVRSLIHTWLLTLRPDRLWRLIDIHDPPAVVPLLVFTMFALLAITSIYVLGLGVEEWVIDRVYGGRWMGPGIPTIAELPIYILRKALTPGLYSVCVWVAPWWAMAFAPLMIFQQSMRRCRVRPRHVFRVVVYALTPQLLFVPVCFWVACVLNIYPWNSNVWRSRQQAFLIGIAAATAYVLHAGWSMRQGYEVYIRMPHATGVAIASLSVTLLTVLNLWLLYYLFAR
jgi:endogenous inhibitor of DNA gyrase (YacG/DUF329 family)